MRIIVKLVALLGVLYGGTPATAYSIVGAIAVVDGQGDGEAPFSDEDDASVGAQGNVGPISAGVVDPYGRASSSGWAQIISELTTTSLRVRASSQSPSELSTAGALASAQYQDTIYVEGPFGEPVKFEKTWNLTYDLSSTAGTSGLCGQDESRISITFQLGGFTNTFSDSTCTGPQGDRNPTIMIDTFGGAELALNVFLNVNSVSGYTGSSSAISDQSLTPFIRSLDSDFRYSTASGNTYLPQNAIPEPSSLLLLVGGLMAFALYRSERSL